MLAVCAVATPALGDDITSKKAAVDQQIDALSSQLAAHRQSEQALRNEIDGVTARIRTLEANVGDVSLQLSTLEQDLALHRERLAKLNKLFKLQSGRLILLKRQYEVAVQRLDRRLVSIYVGGEPSMLEFVFGATSIDDVLDKVDYMSRIARAGPRDRPRGREREGRDGAARGSGRRRCGGRCAGAAHVITARAAQVRETRSALVSARDSLSATKQQKLVALSELSEKERAEASEIDALRASSAQLGAQIRAAQARSSSGSEQRRDAVVGRPRLAGLGPGHEPVRLALGPHARGHRHRRRATARRSTPPPPARSSTAAGRAATGTSS